jgi:IS30 family transposase
MMKQEDYSQKSIADALSRSAATISLELKRNALTDGDYSAIFAHQFECTRAIG